MTDEGQRKLYIWWLKVRVGVKVGGKSKRGERGRDGIRVYEFKLCSFPNDGVQATVKPTRKGDCCCTNQTLKRGWG